MRTRWLTALARVVARSTVGKAVAAIAVGSLAWAGSAGATWDTAANQPFGANGANGIGVDPADGSVWLVSAFDNQVRKYNARGNLLLTIGGFGSGPGQFNLPSALAIGPDGDVYVTDVGNARAQRFTSSGAYVRSYGNSSLLSNPRGVDVDAAGNVYVADIGTGLRRFAADGTLTMTYSAAVASQAFAVAVDPTGGVWVSDFAPSPDVVRKIDPATGSVLQTISGFGQPTDIEIGPDGTVYVLDFNSSTIRTYSADGTFVEATAPISNMLSLALDPYERLFVSGGSQAITLNPEPLVVDLHTGAIGDAAVAPAFAATTLGQTTQTIDFDGDGFDWLAPHTFTPIPSNHYASLGVTLLGLDARSVGTQPWTHSPPIGAWQTGFSQPAQPYSFDFAEPVASFGLYANDTEADVAVTVHLQDGTREFFTLARAGSSMTRFYGLTASADVIDRIDFDSFDYHIIDDVQFGRLADQEPPTITITTPADGAIYDLGELVSVDYTCSDNVGIDSCVGDIPDGALIDTSSPGGGELTVTATDTAGLTSNTSSAYEVSSTLADGLGLTGSITANPAGHPVSVVDAPDPDGATITVGGTGTDKVTLTVCGGFTIRLAPGSEVTLTCGSVIVNVAAGSAEVATPSGNVTMVVPTGGVAELDEFGSATNLGGEPVTVHAGGTVHTLGPGMTADWGAAGYFAPIDMGGVWNTASGGSNLPFKFRISYGGVELTDPSMIDATFVRVPCTGGAEDTVEVLDATATTTLTYDGGQFHLNWKTPKLRGACFEVRVSTEGSPSITAKVRLK